MSVRFKPLRASKTPSGGGPAGTVSYIGGTGILAASSPGTTVQFTVPNVAATRMAILSACMKPSNTAFDSITGWLPIASVAGGTGTEGGTDDAPTRVGMWYRILDGSETTTPIFGGTSCLVIQGVIDVYSSSTGLWATPVFSSGDDITHGGNHDITTVGSIATAAGDFLIAAFASDTDNAGAISAPYVTQAGATLGTATLRSRNLSGTGPDNGIASIDAPVTAGATAVVAAGYTRSNIDCGPAIVARLRAA